MSASQYQRDVERKRGQRADAEKKAGEYRNKESKCRAEAAKARHAATKTKSESTVRSKLREAERAEEKAASAGREASRWQDRAAGYAKDEIAASSKLSRAQRSEADAAERQRKRDEQRRVQKSPPDGAAIESRIRRVESAVQHVVHQMRTPLPEKLRVLILGASSEGDLRVGREQKRIRAAVQSALHRDLIEIDARPAATANDLLDGLSGFRPHVLHFSGHSNQSLIVFEDERDEPHEGVIVTARAFMRAMRATDGPPVLVVLNACNSAAQIDELVAQVVPFAIGMADSIDDSDAINYAAHLYASIADGQSIRSSHLRAQSALELAGLEGADLPMLACSEQADPANTVLVRPPSAE
ncbi:hypothetical protein C0J29_14420 [Mycobacterium paragordonae]|uniref:CHAT domain-containing protein n=1 Tax=Mycobacterium paragordonae TaxID=1389713 RepID=A0ABQ1C423_9MYCO|nr:CHAT domain-containing protein [Mycobacterium paragordonae]AYE95822.1 hypothetical protein C0J29_14420 [Mycobacterium paragordonae]GFG79114.1 CHAT domain-containing protein [Mycobacterium paragordonae]